MLVRAALFGLLERINKGVAAVVTALWAVSLL